MRRAILIVLVAVVSTIALSGCAGFRRNVSSSWAGAVGADWIVVQFGMDGKPFNAWKLPGVSVSNEQNSDGIYWKDTDGHLVHISGWYNRVQVYNGQYETAAKLVGVDIDKVHNGRYIE